MDCYGTMSYGGQYVGINPSRDDNGLNEKKVVLRRRMTMEKRLVELRKEKEILDRDIQSAINGLAFILISPSSPQAMRRYIETAKLELDRARSAIKKKDDEISALIDEMKEDTLTQGVNIRAQEVRVLRSQMTGISSVAIRGCVEREIATVEDMSIEDWIERE